jgi:DNA-binding transcriptional regulator YiaG
MPNFANVLKEEILRLARKETRQATEGLKKAVATHRTEIAALKKRVGDLEKALGRASKQAAPEAAPATAEEGGARRRFSAKRLAAQRQKLGLSAAEMGALLGVSAQTVYNWEAEKSRPRQAQLAAIAAVRSLGKREIKARLQAPPAP